MASDSSRPVRVERARLGHRADRRLVGLAAPCDPLEDPLEHAGVLAVAGPEELAVLALQEPVDVEDLGELVRVRARAHRQPVAEVVGHVVPAERQHGERVATQLADRARGRCRGLRRHDRAEEHAVLPAARLEHERHDRAAPAAEEDRRDRHARGVLPLRRDRWVLCGRGGEPRVRVRRGGALVGRPGLAAPVGHRPPAACRSSTPTRRPRPR